MHHPHDRLLDHSHSELAVWCQLVKKKYDCRLALLVTVFGVYCSEVTASFPAELNDIACAALASGEVVFEALLFC